MVEMPKIAGRRWRELAPDRVAPQQPGTAAPARRARALQHRLAEQTSCYRVRANGYRARSASSKRDRDWSYAIRALMPFGRGGPSRAVVGGPLAWIDKRSVRLVDGLEAGLRLRARVVVWMV